jgi:hypothetical protein
MPEATKMQRLLEAVLEITDNKQSKAEIGGSKGNRSYAQKKRDKVDSEAVRDENVTCFAMSVDQNTSSGEKIVPKKAKKPSPSDLIAGLQEMAEKKHESTQEKLLIAGKKLDFAERKEERRSKDMVERFALTILSFVPFSMFLMPFHISFANNCKSSLQNRKLWRHW